MRSSALDLITEIDQVLPRLGAIPAQKAAEKPDPAHWSRKEIVGHLVDSAVNNLHRFVRGANHAGTLEFPGYAQNDWVRTQGYQSSDWSELLALWEALNRHLAHVLEQLPAEAAQAQCSIGGAPPVTLDFLAADYVRHLRHHLGQLL